MLLGEGCPEKSEHAVAGDVAKGCEFQGIVATMELERAWVGAVPAEGVKHLAAELGEHGRVVFSIHEDGLAVGAHAPFDVWHGTYWSPVVAEFFHGDVVAKAFPDVVSGHALADNVGVVGGEVKETAGLDSRVVHKSDIADGGAEASAEDAQPGVTLLLEPTKATASVLDGLAVGLESQADIWAANLIGAFVALSHSAVVVGHAHLQRGDAEACHPFA